MKTCYGLKKYCRHQVKGDGMKLFRLFLMTSLILNLLACSGSSLQTEVDFDQNALFSNLKTYQWLDIGIELIKELDAEQIALIENTITRGVDQALTQKGYKQTFEQPDFLVAVQAAVTDESQVTVMNDAYQYPMGWGAGKRYTLGGRNRPRQFVYQYKQGTLIIDIVNARSQKLMWRGTAADELKSDKTFEQRLKIVAKAVDEIIGDFPPE